jgi:hypothetical protein
MKIYFKGLTDAQRSRRAHTAHSLYLIYFVVFGFVMNDLQIVMAGGQAFESPIELFFYREFELSSLVDP